MSPVPRRVLVLTILALLVPAHAADDKPTLLFNGTDLTGWSVTDKDRAALWSLAQSVQLDPKNPKALVSTGKPQGADGLLVAKLKDFQGTNLVSAQKFGDCTLRLEFLLPKDGNSGLFLMGLYELQLTDSTGIPDARMQEGDMGGIPFFKKPLANASGKPGEWQTCEVTFRAPRFDAAGKKTAPARIIKATINNKTVQEN